MTLQTWTPFRVSADRLILSPPTAWRLSGVTGRVMLGVDVFAAFSGEVVAGRGMNRDTVFVCLNCAIVACWPILNDNCPNCGKSDTKQRATHGDVVKMIFQAIDSHPDLTFLLSTSTPARVREHWPRPWWSSAAGPCAGPWDDRENVWLGLRCSDQAGLDEGMLSLLEAKELAGELWLNLAPNSRIDLCRVLGIWWNCTTGQYQRELPSHVQFVRLTAPAASPHADAIIEQARAAGVECEVTTFTEDQSQ